MCGIAALIVRGRAGGGEVTAAADEAGRRLLTVMLQPIAYRGDREHFGELRVLDGALLGTNRLAIVGREDGRQPVGDASGRIWAILNGEIYNFAVLREQLTGLGYEFATHTDTEILVHGYREWGSDLVRRLDGMFAFVIYDKIDGTFLAARDHIGIKPLYWAEEGGALYFGSEQKCILPFCRDIQSLPPGHYMEDGEIRRYHHLDDTPLDLSEPEIIATCRRLFEEAVKKRVQTDLPIAVTFSGGLDSTAVLHFARRHHPDVTAFTIGFEGAADVEVAKRYCRQFGIRHVVSTLREEELVDLIPRVVYEAEFFEGVDVMDTCVGYFAYQQIHEHGIKVALCGEGSDEVLAGYDLFRDHPDKVALMKYRVGNLHRTDVQRVDRSSMMNSVEARVPFLDRDFLAFAYRVPMSMKLRGEVEKWVLREALRQDLPDYIADRRKVRMPDGTGLKNFLFDYASRGASLSDEVTRSLAIRTPQEAFFLKQYFDAGFPVPRERFRRPSFDFSEHGYFNFVS